MRNHPEDDSTAPDLSTDEDADDEEEYEEEYLESKFAVLIEMDVKCLCIDSFCDAITDGIEFNRDDNENVLSCYGLRRVPDPLVSRDIEKQPSTPCALRPNFILKTVCTNMEDFEASLNNKKGIQSFHQFLNKNLFEVFPKFSFWDRYNGEYCVTRDPPIGDGKFFMMLNVKVVLPTTKQLENRKRHRSVASFIQQKRIKQIDGVPCQERKEEDPPAPVHAEVLALASIFTEIGKKTMMEECCECVKYDVLMPNGPERANELLIWASWASVDAYIHHTKQPYANLDNIDCVNKPIIVKNASFWERENDGCITRAASRA